MEPDEAFIRAFLNACASGDLSSTQEAISSGRLSTENLDEGLERAAREAHPDVVSILFDAGARAISAKDWLTGTQPQMPGIIRQFFDHGLDPNSSLSNGEPFLCILRNPPQGQVPLRDWRVPLARALKSVSGEDLSMVELLLAYGAKLESHLLFRVIDRRVREMEFTTKFLLANGLDPNTTHEILGTPLHRAIALGLTDIIKVLLDAGADRTARPAGTPHHDESPLQLAERSESPAKQAMLDILGSE
ncbi:uncharacterized protein N7446_005025 [Penicillium canescens]|uniref:uncharacterized protein n=1 Tax=Penicillium canescens TaxID=5083 RepID=UPI0026E084A3|nr:uncharacterized protein N7446_005025 [Penicillium canescens]KAJ6067988.1 hypothetical protein N7446_005025 [Penicillium canescens]